MKGNSGSTDRASTQPGGRILPLAMSCTGARPPIARERGSPGECSDQPHPRGCMDVWAESGPRTVPGCTAARRRPPTRRPRSNRRPGAVGRCGQVFGLTSKSAARRRLLAVASRSRGPVLDDGVRSRLPLRGSPRIALGSLLSPAGAGHQHGLHYVARGASCQPASTRARHAREARRNSARDPV